MAGAYAVDEPAESDKTMKVEQAGRKCVRNIHQHAVLSAEWLNLVDSLKQLTRLVTLEQRMPANAKVSETVGRVSASEGTLWDQEAHESAIRILVEEAKCNLCLRMMNDFKRWQYTPSQMEASMQQAMQVTEYNQAQLEQKVLQFEECLGMLLEKAFSHVESLQLMDIPLLIEHTAFVLNAVAAGRAPSNPKDQETFALYYFSSLMKHAEALNNGELLARARESELVHLAVRCILTYPDAYSGEVHLEVLLGLAALCDNEDFQTNWREFFQADTDLGLASDKKAHFQMIEGQICSPYLEKLDDTEKRQKTKTLRPLLDFFNTLRRS